MSSEMTDEPLWSLAKKWYKIADDERYGDHTRNRFRECANELEDVLAERERPDQRQNRLITDAIAEELRAGCATRGCSRSAIHHVHAGPAEL